MIELLMQICTPEQRPKIIDCLHTGDVQKFWPLLEKERRMEIFAAFEPAQKMKFMVCDDYLTADLKIRLWDNIGKESRLQMWRSTNNSAVAQQCQEIEEEKS